MSSDAHPLDRATDGLWQCLAQDKRPLGVLVGAGCPGSVHIEREGIDSPLIPDVAGLTATVIEELSAGDLHEPLERLTNGLKQDLERAPNLEDMLTRLRTLKTVVGGEAVRGLKGQEIADLEKGITNRISERLDVQLPEERTPYDDLAVWVGAIRRLTPVNLFTTNYDLLVEEALERNTVPFFDGFVGSREPFLDVGPTEQDDDVPARWARLWKLHGSTNWTLLSDGAVVRRTPSSADEQRLIHPSHLKYQESRRMPYLAMQDRFRAFLREPSATLVTIGYSFRDEHINDLIVQGLRGNASGAAFALLYGGLEKYPQGAQLALSSPNLQLFARDRGCLSGNEGPWSNGDDDEEMVVCQLGDFREFGRQLRRLAAPGPRGVDPGAG